MSRLHFHADNKVSLRAGIVAWAQKSMRKVACSQMPEHLI